MIWQARGIVERVGDPAQSRKMLQPLWGGGNPEEARADLQSRLIAFCKAIFWAFFALIIFLFVMYAKYEGVQPRYQAYVYAVATVALLLLAIIWRGVLLRRPELSQRVLYALDSFILIGSGTTFGSIACIAYDLQASSYTCLIYHSFVVFTRALLVPSSERRTALVSALSFVPIATGAAVLALTRDVGLPGPAFFVGAVLYNLVAVLLAARGSRIIYGLRSQVREAMQLGQYFLEHQIGEGGMGVVYRARHILLRRPTAVKLMQASTPESLVRFQREVQAMSELTHPNTVTVFDYGPTGDGRFYYAMEYLGDGIDLDRLVRSHGAQTSGRVTHILIQVCGALHEAHERGMVHRDIKPQNIILCERGLVPDVAKVVDFGLVKELSEDTGASTQVILGTPAYMAPELVIDPRQVAPAVDIYALGCVGYFLVTGRKVFEGVKTSVDVMVHHRVMAPKKPSEVASVEIPEALEAIIMRCLEKDPTQRFASAAELGEALAALPPARDWSEAEAALWWRGFKARQHEVDAAASSPTLTLPIDLGRRDATRENRVNRRAG
jgi:serine/threonine-protein kinase